VTVRRLGESDRTVASLAEDIGGRKVSDRDGDDLGDVDDLVLAERERRISFVRVSAGAWPPGYEPNRRPSTSIRRARTRPTCLHAGRTVDGLPCGDCLKGAALPVILARFSLFDANGHSQLVLHGQPAPERAAAPS
jgi:hypothetical protein